MSEDDFGPENLDAEESFLGTKIEVQFVVPPLPEDLPIACLPIREPNKPPAPATVYLYDPTTFSHQELTMEFDETERVWVEKSRKPRHEPEHKTPSTVVSNLDTTISLLMIYAEQPLAERESTPDEFRALVQTQLGLPPVVLSEDFIDDNLEQVTTLLSLGRELYGLQHSESEGDADEIPPLLDEFREVLTQGLLAENPDFRNGRPMLAVDRAVNDEGKGWLLLA